MREIERIVDDEKRSKFEELKDKVLSLPDLSVTQILDEVELLVHPDKKDRLEILRYLLVESTPMDKKFQGLIKLTKAGKNSPRLSLETSRVNTYTSEP